MGFACGLDREVRPCCSNWRSAGCERLGEKQKTNATDDSMRVKRTSGGTRPVNIDESQFWYVLSSLLVRNVAAFALRPDPASDLRRVRAGMLC